MDGITGISAISQQEAASTEEIAAIIHEQVDTMKDLAIEAERVDSQAKGLNEMLQRFQV